MQWRKKEGGWMGVMEVNRKGWTARCMDITRMEIIGAAEERQGSTSLYRLTKDTDFLPHCDPFV